MIYAAGLSAHIRPNREMFLTYIGYKLLIIREETELSLKGQKYFKDKQTAVYEEAAFVLKDIQLPKLFCPDKNLKIFFFWCIKFI